MFARNVSLHLKSNMLVRLYTGIREGRSSFAAKATRL